MKKKKGKSNRGYKRKVDKKMRDYGEINFVDRVIRINPKKGDMLNTILHEELHRKYPTKSEKWIEKKSVKEESQLTPGKAIKILKKYTSR